jgi:hypothetical protein
MFKLWNQILTIQTNGFHKAKINIKLCCRLTLLPSVQIDRFNLKRRCWRSKFTELPSKEKTLTAVWREAVWKLCATLWSVVWSWRRAVCISFGIIVDISCIRGGVCWCIIHQSSAPYIKSTSPHDSLIKTLSNWAAHQVIQVQENILDDQSSEDFLLSVKTIPHRRVVVWKEAAQEEPSESLNLG